MFLFPAALPPKNAVHSDVATSTHLLPPTSSMLLPGTTGTSGKLTLVSYHLHSYQNHMSRTRLYLQLLHQFPKKNSMIKNVTAPRVKGVSGPF